MRHKHADIIHAWAEGAEIEYKCPIEGTWHYVSYPKFMSSCHYRIKPKEPAWWENIPEHGILVRIKSLGRIVWLTEAYYSEDWEPLTNEEIERFKR